MKPQDLLFVLILAGLMFLRKSNWFIIAGLLFVTLSIPLFAKHVFFTAEHLTYYAVGFVLVGIGYKLYENRN